MVYKNEYRCSWLRSLRSRVAIAGTGAKVNEW